MRLIRTRSEAFQPRWIDDAAKKIMPPWGAAVAFTLGAALLVGGARGGKMRWDRGTP